MLTESKALAKSFGGKEQIVRLLRKIYTALTERCHPHSKSFYQKQNTVAVSQSYALEICQIINTEASVQQVICTLSTPPNNILRRLEYIDVNLLNVQPKERKLTECQN